MNVVVCHAPCVIHERKLGQTDDQLPFTVDQQACNGCTLCVRMLGCPAILLVGGEYVIDPDLCTGCEVCADLCQHDAIHRVEGERV